MKQKQVLLVEPDYTSKYPPIGLMKIATNHSLLGHKITFSRGKAKKLQDENWDYIYITTLFTFDWKKAVETIKFYSKDSKKKPVVGGVMASLMSDELETETGIRPHRGPLTWSLPGTVGVAEADSDLVKIKNNILERGIDALPPDYGIFDEEIVPYKQVLENTYILRTTRGCHRGCDFCGVGTIEPKFVKRIELNPLINYISRRWGEKQNLVLLDDNTLLSSDFELIIDEIRDLGFERGSKFRKRKRSVDFNQGLDVRLLTRKRLKKLSTIEVRPLRLAFDHYESRSQYVQKIMWALDLGWKEISSYVLYNHKDTPSDFYNRLVIASEMNERYGCRIYSFPMKYIPCNSKSRSHLGENWTRRQIRGVQCILNSMHGIAPTQPDFLRRAFGQDLEEFLQITQMPENYIVYRSKYKTNGLIDEWTKCYRSMSKNERKEAFELIKGGKGTLPKSSTKPKLREFLGHYNNENG